MNGLNSGINKSALAEIITLNEDRRIELESGLERYRSDDATIMAPCIYEPSVALIVQGKKQIIHGDNISVYGPGSLLLTTVHTPVISAVSEASPETPYLGLVFRLDMDVIAEYIEKMPVRTATSDQIFKSIMAWEADDALVDSFYRLVQASLSDELKTFILPLLKKEIVIRLLAGGGGSLIRQTLINTNSVGKISKAIQWIRENYHLPFNLDELADSVYMSPSTFRQYFKKVTGSSPLQYQKNVRLHEARKLMVNGEQDVSHAGMQVGYESVSQFSREYRRFFGQPPLRDIRTIKTSMKDVNNRYIPDEF